jgi:hypothetical protein
MAKKNTVVNAKENTGAAQKARKAGPHGKVTQADGSKQSTPGKPHTPKDKAGSAVLDRLK